MKKGEGTAPHKKELKRQDNQKQYVNPDWIIV